MKILGDSFGRKVGGGGHGPGGPTGSYAYDYIYLDIEHILLIYYKEHTLYIEHRLSNKITSPKLVKSMNL